jgi:hypothetical protein
MEIDISNFPKVKVVFPETLDEYNFQYLINTWNELYDQQKDFEFIFDTRKLSSVPFQYCYEIAVFISLLKERPVQYLKKSIIIVDSYWIQKLLDVVFMIQKPVSKVNIVNSDGDLISEL